jgi:hypothetical protein
MIGAIYGGMAIHQIHVSDGRLRGTGLATAGLVVSVVVTLLVAAVVLPGFRDRSPVEEEWNWWSIAGAKEVQSAMRSYARDHDHTLPAATGWIDALRPHHPNLEPFLASRWDPEGRRAYAMNTHLGGVSLREVEKPTRTVLLFEVDPGASPAGGPELVPAAPRFKDGYVALFVDGTVRNVPREEMQTLHWKPYVGPRARTATHTP